MLHFDGSYFGRISKDAGASDARAHSGWGGQPYLRREKRQLSTQPAVQLIEAGLDLDVTHRGTLLCGLITHDVLDRVQGVDAL